MALTALVTNERRTVQLRSLEAARLRRDHEAWVSQHGIRVTFSTAEEQQCRTWAQAIRRNKTTQRSDGTFEGASYEVRNYLGIKSEYALARYHAVPYTCELFPARDPGYDLILGSTTYDVKFRQAWLVLNIGDVIDRALFLVNPHPDRTGALYLCGSLSPARYLAERFLCDLGYGLRYCVSATALQCLGKGED